MSEYNINITIECDITTDLIGMELLSNLEEYIKLFPSYFDNMQMEVKQKDILISEKVSEL